MSQENVENVRRGWDARSRGDLDAVLAFFDPEIEWDTTNYEGWPEDGVYRGHHGVRKFLEDWLGSWDRYGVDPGLPVEGREALAQRGLVGPPEGLRLRWAGGVEVPHGR